LSGGDLTEVELRIFDPLLPDRGKRGPLRSDKRRTVNGAAKPIGCVVREGVVTWSNDDAERDCGRDFRRGDDLAPRGYRRDA
jgi:hypothetical protein